jgi:hypothetical protein
MTTAALYEPKRTYQQALRGQPASYLEKARAILERTQDELRGVIHDMPASDKDGRDYVQQGIDMCSDAMIQIAEEDKRRADDEHREWFAELERAEQEDRRVLANPQMCGR